MAIVNLSKPGWCTPTILVALLGLVSVVTLVVQLVTYQENDEEDNGRMSIAIAGGVKLLWTVGIASVLFYLCSNGKTQAAWWVFAVLYIVPTVILFLVLMMAVWAAKKNQS